MIEHLTTKAAAALVAGLLLASGSAALLLVSGAGDAEALRRLAASFAREVDRLRGLPGEGAVQLTGEDGVLPTTLGGEVVQLVVTARGVTASWRGREATAAFAAPIHPWHPAPFAFDGDEVAERDTGSRTFTTATASWGWRATVRVDGVLTSGRFLVLAGDPGVPR